jgi:ribonuclease T2
MRFIFTLWLFTYVVFANMDIYPKKECQLFNNLKHTKNRGDEVLKLDRPYEMIQHHKAQYLVKVEGATPPQRWVDDECLSLRPLRGTPIYEAMHNKPVKPVVQKRVNIEEELSRADAKKAKKPQKHYAKKSTSSKQNLLALSWHNAFCETHRYKKECKRGLSSLIRSKARDKSFVLHGLWPQPRSNVYCRVNSNEKYLDKNKKWHKLKNLGLSSSTKEALKAVMPGFSSNLHKHEWIKHGTCYGTDADTYFKTAVRLVHQVNSSALGAFFTQNMGKRITLKEVQVLADKSFGRGAGKRVALQCNRGLVTELWFYIGSGSDDLATLLQSGKPTRSRCIGGRIDKAGYGR